MGNRDRGFSCIVLYCRAHCDSKTSRSKQGYSRSVSTIQNCSADSSVDVVVCTVLPMYCKIVGGMEGFSAAPASKPTLQYSVQCGGQSRENLARPRTVRCWESGRAVTRTYITQMTLPIQFIRSLKYFKRKNIVIPREQVRTSSVCGEQAWNVLHHRQI